MCQLVPCCELLLVTDGQAASLARQFLTEQLCAAHCSQVVDEALLLMTEAVTNAVCHGLPPVLITLGCDGSGGLQVRVRDANPTSPRLLAPGPLDEHGRGMQLIDTLSDRWGVDRDAPGKAVWFVLSRSAG